MMFALILGLSLSGALYADSVVPERVVTPLLDLYAPAEEISPGLMVVRALSVTETGDLFQNGETAQVKKDLFEHLIGLGSAVYEVVNSDKLASAVHIGEGLVLTNHHVLTDMGNKPEECGSFRPKDKASKWMLACRKVLFCSRQDDLCLVEMGEFVRRGQTVTLKGRAALKLSTAFAWDDNVVLTAIGNTLGLGIHASRGKGLRFFNPDIAFYAPTATGNSGGALLNEKGLLIGIVKSGTVLKISSDPVMAFNMAVGTPRIIELAKGMLNGSDLVNFNKAIED